MVFSEEGKFFLPETRESFIITNRYGLKQAGVDMNRKMLAEYQDRIFYMGHTRG